MLALPSDGAALFRLVWNDPPEPEDFRSFVQMRGLPFKGDPSAAIVLLQGVSMFATPSQALSRARKEPKIVAMISLEAGRGIHVAKTFGAGHYTVWGDPEQLARRALVFHAEGA